MKPYIDISLMQLLSQKDSHNVFGFLGDQRFWSQSLESLRGTTMANGFNFVPSGCPAQFRIGIEEGEIPNIRFQTTASIKSESTDLEDLSLLSDLGSLGFQGPRDIEITTIVSFGVKELHDPHDHLFNSILNISSPSRTTKSEIVYEARCSMEVCDVVDGMPTELVTLKDTKIRLNQVFTQELIMSHDAVTFKELFLYRFFKESSSKTMEYIKEEWINQINIHLGSQKLRRTRLNRHNRTWRNCGA